MSEAGRVGNDGIGNEGSIGSNLISETLRIRYRDASSIARLEARPPATLYDGGHRFSPVSYILRIEGVLFGNQSRVLHHESHQFGRIATNAEEFQAIIDNEFSEDGMGGKPDSMAMMRLQPFAKGNEWLHISAGTDNMDHNVQSRKWILWLWRCFRPRGGRRWLEGAGTSPFFGLIGIYEWSETAPELLLTIGESDINPSVRCSTITTERLWRRAALWMCPYLQDSPW